MVLLPTDQTNGFEKGGAGKKKFAYTNVFIIYETLAYLGIKGSKYISKKMK